MTKIRKLFPRYLSFAMVLLLFASTSAQAQDNGDVLNRTFSKWREQPVINDSSLAILSSFAHEWNQLAIDYLNNQELMIQMDLSVFKNKKPQEIAELLHNLIYNSEAVDWFSNSNVQSTFDSIYEHAIESNSPIGAMPRDTIQEYWVISKVVTDENLDDYFLVENIPRTAYYYCAWILWSCENPPLPPQLENDRGYRMAAAPDGAQMDSTWTFRLLQDAFLFYEGDGEQHVIVEAYAASAAMPPPSQDLHITVSTRADTAMSPDDYTALSEIVSFPASSFNDDVDGIQRSRATFTFTPKSDEIVEADETLSFLIENSPGGPNMQFEGPDGTIRGDATYPVYPVTIRS